MKYPAIGIAILFFTLVSLSSCQMDGDKGKEGEGVDSVISQILDSAEVVSTQQNPIVPELLGTWVVVRMTLDKTTDLSQDVIGKMTYTFSENGQFVIDTKDEFDPETFTFSYGQNSIASTYFPKGEARITKLNSDSMVFVIEAGGGAPGEVEYTLEKQD